MSWGFDDGGVDEPFDCRGLSSSLPTRLEVNITGCAYRENIVHYHSPIAREMPVYTYTCSETLQGRMGTSRHADDVPQRKRTECLHVAQFGFLYCPTWCSLTPSRYSFRCPIKWKCSTPRQLWPHRLPPITTSDWSRASTTRLDVVELDWH